MKKQVKELKEISDRLAKGEVIDEKVMQDLIDKCSNNEILEVFNYCMKK